MGSPTRAAEQESEPASPDQNTSPTAVVVKSIGDQVREYSESEYDDIPAWVKNQPGFQQALMAEQGAEALQAAIEDQANAAVQKELNSKPNYTAVEKAIKDYEAFQADMDKRFGGD